MYNRFHEIKNPGYGPGLIQEHGRMNDMHKSNDYNIEQAFDNIKQIFALQNELICKDMKIISLQFEIEIQKKMLDLLYGVQLKKFMADESAV